MSRVLQIPHDHSYVRESTPVTLTGTVGSPSGIPSPALKLDWLAAHHHEFDLVHLHFGFEHLSPAELQQWVEALAGYGLPLVYTVHDLRNPHQDSSLPHDRHLDVLIPAASAVLTLTRGAAQEIARRWDVAAQVVEHPSVIDLDSRPARGLPGRLVGIHLKDLRRNIVEADRVIEAVCQGALAGGGRLRVDLHPDALTRPELAGTRALAEQGRLELAVHERFSDGELAGYLAGLDVYVLPHRFGTHSGWLEACRDMGTRIVAPSCGYYRDQWDDVITYRNDETGGLDEADLAEAVTRALAGPPVAPVDAGLRRRQRARVRADHALLYERLSTSCPVLR